MQNEVAQSQIVPRSQLIKSPPTFANGKDGEFIGGGRYIAEAGASSLDDRAEAKTFLAWDLKTRQLVGVKAYTEENRERAEREVEATVSAGADASLIKEGNIVFVVTSAYVEGFLKDGSLRYRPLDVSSILERGGLEGIDIKLDILVGLYKRIMELWEKGLVHWDLKPANMVLIEGEVYLIDFELSGSINEPLKKDGTPIYASPERLRLEDVEPEELILSETFSFGLIAFEILFGENLFYEYFNEDEDEIRRAMNNMNLELSALPMTKTFNEIIDNCQDYSDQKRDSLKELFKQVLRVKPEERLSIDVFMHELNSILSN